MHYQASLLLMAGIYLAVLVSPGPNFFILSQMALDGHGHSARYVVQGLTSSGLAWALLSIAGVAALLAQHPQLAMALRWLGAAYLVWYGVKLLRAAWRGCTHAQSLSQAPRSRGAAFRMGWFTGMTNPKGAAFWTSAFAASFPAQAPTWFYGITLLLVAVMSLSWHLGITQVFGIPALRSGYLRMERAISGLSGAALVLLGAQRAVSR
ncbi:LysE family transporter [Comamonas sp. GB3 AK4-5]|uniref:LysE family transporter n=1 Tax=Comamonas sp. GB3 AK4-5 TaxID=3231487 RepID=UPI00351E3783